MTAALAAFLGYQTSPVRCWPIRSVLVLTTDYQTSPVRHSHTSGVWVSRS